eukprot:m.191324 g.191324  ORF g.191324 m.191324 type:complete len:247 (+) comp39447_c1_seq15:173-913(+)
MLFSAHQSVILLLFCLATSKSESLRLTLPSGPDVVIGRHVTFLCNGEDSLAVRQWKKDGDILDLSTSRYHTNLKKSILLVDPSKERDSGSYECTVRSVSGQNVTSNVVELRILVKPALSPRPRNVFAQEGKMATLKCEGNNLTYIDWYNFKGIALYNHPKCSIKGAFGEVLKIRQITKEDAGQYRCTAVNRFPILTTSRYSSLTVEYAPVIVEQPVDLATVEGYEVHMSCNVDAVPSTEIKWKKDG